MTRLKYERRERRWSQTTVAAAVGLQQCDISRIERGILVPTPLQLERLAAVFNLHQTELLKEVVIMTVQPIGVA